MHQGRYSKLIKSIVLAGDLIILNASYLLTCNFLYEGWDGFASQQNYYVWLFLNLVYILVFANTKINLNKRIIRKERTLKNVARNVVFTFLFLLAILVLISEGTIPRHFILRLFGIILAGLVAWRFLFTIFLFQYRKAGKNRRNFVIVGNGETACKLKDTLTQDPTLGYHFLGFVRTSNGQQAVEVNRNEILGTLEEIDRIINTYVVEEIYCISPDTPKQKIGRLIEYAEDNMIRVKVIPDFEQYIRKSVNLNFVGQFPVIQLRSEPLEFYGNRVLKRIFDVVFSLFVLVAIFPWLFPILALSVKLSSPGPVFFKQLRTGENNKEFTCLKFRTMKKSKEADLKQANKDDMRITRTGKFMRKSNLDELPQFFNVLAGHMTVVGPRPHMLKHTEEYSRIIKRYMVRHFVKPGITGWAQVNGYRGETHSPDLMEKRVQHDVWYIENWSFWLDLRIVFLTVWNIFKGEENAY